LICTPLFSSDDMTGVTSLGQNQITHDHRICTGLAKRHPAAERQCRFEFYGLDSHLQVAAGKTEFIYSVWLSFNWLSFPGLLAGGLASKLRSAAKNKTNEGHS
jgi:hypothetical protein